MQRAAAAKLLLLIAAAVGSLSPAAGALQRPHEPEAGNGSALCRPHERDALLAFKRGITKDPSGFLTSWRSGQDCCRWSGISCSRKTGNVVQLELNGTFDPTQGLVGQISPSLLSLEHLEYLDLSYNLLEGPNRSVPEFMGFMKNLRHLDLSYIPFSGTVPPLFGNLTELEYLNLSNTSFYGALPPQLGNLTKLRYLDLGRMQNPYATDVSWLANLYLLEYIDMSQTNLRTIVDFPLVANMIPTLKHIYLFNCSLPSANQSISHLNLTALEALDLSQNYFGHPVASCWFWNVTSLKSLRLVSTYLGGPFPDALGEMVLLQLLDISHNGNAATMTVGLKNLCELQYLWLEWSLSSGNITQFIQNLPQCSNNKLISLISAGNNMKGVLPNMMEHLTGLDYLDLSNNSISSAIPPEIGNLSILSALFLGSNQLSGQIPLLPTSMEILDISMNCLSGHLPLKFGSPNLVLLSLNSNSITGKVPETICDSQNMQLLDLSNNLFEGELPRCSGRKQMESLLLSNNSFSGMFPTWIQSLSSLVFLDLSWNKLHGPIPRWIGNFASLRFLHLSHNMFSGYIPENITDLRALQYLNLASNNISGLMPLSWSKLVQMTMNYTVEPWDDASYFTLWPGSIQDILSLVMKSSVLTYGPEAIVNLVGIDLSLNYLTGEIPDEVTSLNRLLILNLSCNHLSGKILKNIGSMKSMESLDLSRNHLTGEIPPSLSDLTYLSSLDLSNNNLTGRIPSGRQLDTLYSGNPSIYDGNSGLCGPPLGRNCSGRNSTRSGNEMRENYSEPIFFYLGFASGFTAGLWVVFCLLLFRKTWRVWYYHVFDRLYDKVYAFMSQTHGRSARQAT